VVLLRFGVTESVHEALDRLNAAWVANRAPVADHLAGPRPAEEVTAILTSVGFDAPEELVSWFTWHDGHTIDRGGRYLAESGIGGYQLMTLNECLGELRVWREVAAEEPELNDWKWDHSWFPLMRNGGGDAVVVVTDQGSPCPAGEFTAVGGYRQVATSLSDLILVWVRRIEQQEWTWHPLPGGGSWQSEPAGRLNGRL
jgi:cell wall assembly regulator SMI1